MNILNSRPCSVIPPLRIRAALVLFVTWLSAGITASDEIEFSDVQPILTKYCAGCHQADDANGDFALDSFAALVEGGSTGKAITPGSAQSSRMIQMMLNKLDPKMPPDGEAEPTQDEIQLVADWVDGGANGPTGESIWSTELDAPQLPTYSNLRPVTALAYSPDGTRLAVARFGNVQICNQDGEVEQTIDKLAGKIGAVLFDATGEKLFIGTGVTGLYGEVAQIDVASCEIERRMKGHRDLVYDIALAENDSVLASVGYDRNAVLWDLKTGEKLSVLSGHNGAIFEADFSAKSRVLLTASADATVKVWNVESGNRLDTRSEPLKEQYTVASGPNGSTFVAAGADNRIRKWTLESIDRSAINPLLVSRFAHEAAIQQLTYHPSGEYIVSVATDDSIKIWDANTLTELFSTQFEGKEIQAIAVSNDVLSYGGMNGAVHQMEWPTDLSSSGQKNLKNIEARNLIPNIDPNSLPEVVESEPNDSIADSNRLVTPGRFKGKILAKDHTDRDRVRFDSKAGQSWVIEIKTSSKDSKLDSHIAVLDSNDQPVPRVLLQAVRDSYFTFRGKDSRQTGDFRIQNWEEMKINQYLYCNGEVVKLFHYPRGPDSGFNVFPNFGNRHAFFDTTPITHALNEPCFVVEAFPPDTELASSGLPLFRLNYENDDDAQQENGKDSRLSFVAPADGTYFVEVRDARGFQGDDFDYELTIRPPKPSFRIRNLIGDDAKVVPGGFKKVGVEIDRIDGFDEPIDIQIENLPPGISYSGPTTVEAGQLRAWLLIHAASDAAELEESGAAFVASANSGGKTLKDSKAFKKITLETDPKLGVSLKGNSDSTGEMPVIEIQAGTTGSTMLSVDRLKHDGRINFGKENAGVNFPFGVFVDNIGLNGVLIQPNENEREIFITAESFVEPGDRIVFLEAEEAGRPSSNPAILRVLPAK